MEPAGVLLTALALALFGGWVHARTASAQRGRVGACITALAAAAR